MVTPSAASAAAAGAAAAAIFVEDVDVEIPRRRYVSEETDAARASNGLNDERCLVTGGAERRRRFG